MFLNTSLLSLDSSVNPDSNPEVPEGLRGEFSRVSGTVFGAAVLQFIHDNPHRAEDIELLEDYEQAECWLGNSGDAGFAITPEYELVNLFSRRAGCGADALKFAQITYQNIKLNCHAGKLANFYASYGFRINRHEPNWFSTPEKELPKVVYMSWNKG